MQLLILIEPTEDGRFRATAGDPFGMSAEASTAEEAARRLETALRDRLQTGSRLASLDLGNGFPSLPPTPIPLELPPGDDWFFQAMNEAIAENRRRDDEANGR